MKYSIITSNKEQLFPMTNEDYILYFKQICKELSKNSNKIRNIDNLNDFCERFGFNKKFIVELFRFNKKNILHLNLQGGQGNLSAQNILKLHFNFPCLEEQQKIGDFLSDFDVAISLAKQELEKWKLLKKGLLQQMFT